MNSYSENELSRFIFDAALKVHRALGPGLLERVYEECLFYELNDNGLSIERQKPLALIYKDIKLEAGYRLDLVVNGLVIIEVKAAEKLTEVHTAQLLTYLKLSKCKLGMLINFNSILLKKGIRRVVNGLKE